jgi:hypothetical protein
MGTRQPLQPSPKLQALQRDFQQIAAMAGYANASMDPPQLRLFFTLYGRITVKDAPDGLAVTPRHELVRWSLTTPKSDIVDRPDAEGATVSDDPRS